MIQIEVSLVLGSLGYVILSWFLKNGKIKQIDFGDEEILERRFDMDQGEEM